MSYVIVAFGASIAGLVQSIAGFGAGMMLMMFLPYILNMLQATGLTTGICLTLSAVLFIRYRKNADYKRVCAFSAAYIIVSSSIISVIKNINLEYLSIAFGVFLIIVSLKNLFGKETRKIAQTIPLAILYGSIGGLCSGLFAMGGPMWALYFLSSADDRDNYMGNTQACGTFTAFAETATRTINGIFTIDVIPLALVGVIFINIGKRLGMAWAGKMDAKLVGKIIYVFVGICGLVTIYRKLAI